MAALPPPSPTPPEPPEPLLELGALVDHLGFMLRAVRRHPGRCLATLLLVLGASAASLVILPRSYHVEAQLLAQQNYLLPALADPSRAVPQDMSEPTRGAAQLTLNRESLLAIIRDNDLVTNWDRSRSPGQRVLDRALALVHRPSEADRTEALTGLLEKRLSVTSDQGVVHIEVDWPNAYAAAALVSSAQNAFLAARQEVDTAPISETVAILEEHVKALRADAEQADAELREAQAKVTKEDTEREAEERKNDPERLRASLLPHRPAPRPEAERARAELNEKRAAINELESARRQRLEALRAQLINLRASYTPAHPSVRAVELSIAQESREPEQLTALRAEARALAAQLASLGPSSAGPSGGAMESLLAGAMVASSVAPARRPTTEAERAAERALDRVRGADAKVDELARRLSAAKLELDAARAAFKYRYRVVKPAEVPHKPARGGPALTLLAGLLGGLALAVLAAAAADLRSGLVLEPWQLERQLSLRVLGGVPQR